MATLDAVTVPVNVGFARGAFDAIEFVTVVENAASLPRAAANSFNVSSAAGALATKLSTALFTNAVVASCVVFVPAVAVGAVGTPVKAGDARFAFVDAAVVTNAVVASCVVFVPAVAVGALGTPVKVGDARSAFNAIALLTDVNEASTIVVVAFKAIALLTDVNEASTIVLVAFNAIALLTDVNEASTILWVAFKAIALLTDVNEASTMLWVAFKLSAVCMEVDIPLIALAGIEAAAYCAYKLPQISTLLLIVNLLTVRSRI